MRKIFTILVAVFLTATVWAQVPQKMSYQAVIRNASNALVANSNVGMQISILQGSTSGTAVYVETQTPTTNANGLISIEIGGGVSISGNFATINWANGPYFVKTETDPAGGASYTITGISQLLSVPFALHAKTADSVVNGFSGNYNDLTNQPTIPTVPNTVSSFTNDAGYLTSFTEVDSSVTNELQDLTQVLNKGNDAGSQSMVNIGAIGVGTTTPHPGAAIDINSTTGALLLPRMTTEQRDSISPVVGMLIYNTSSHKCQVHAGPAAVIDQQQTVNLGEISNAGQSFKAGITGNWTKLALTCSTPQTGVLEIYSGEGMSGTLIHSQPISVVGGHVVTEIVLTTPVSIVSGQQYTFKTNIDVRFSYTTNSYLNGTAYYQTTAYNGDLVFKIIVGGSNWIDLN